ncbi:hypothetical protein RRG08_031550 [Elysia crispata]|uniref:Uncharacterized protein n=1 Tax=Elysia crispata TaxID=231223 RepID=A0AAE1AGI6_9GAST|nr:hypothetical protein RRG08_031550 [Elysia crispata]
MVVDGPRLISLFTLDRCDSAFLVTSEVPIQRQARNFSVLNAGSVEDLGRKVEYGTFRVSLCILALHAFENFLI